MSKGRKLVPKPKPFSLSPFFYFNFLTISPQIILFFLPFSSLLFLLISTILHPHFLYWFSSFWLSFYLFLPIFFCGFSLSFSTLFFSSLCFLSQANSLFLFPFTIFAHSFFSIFSSFSTHFYIYSLPSPFSVYFFPFSFLPLTLFSFASFPYPYSFPSFPYLYSFLLFLFLFSVFLYLSSFFFFFSFIFIHSHFSSLHVYSFLNFILIFFFPTFLTSFSYLLSPLSILIFFLLLPLTILSLYFFPQFFYLFLTLNQFHWFSIDCLSQILIVNMIMVFPISQPK